MNRLLGMEIRLEQDVVLARQRARQLAGLLGFEIRDQTGLGTAVSEIARNAFQYAGSGRVDFLVEAGAAPLFLIRISDRGPGIADLPAVLEGRYRSSTGLGRGLAGAARLMDRFEVDSTPQTGTTVLLGKALPRRAAPLTPAALARMADELTRRSPETPFEEVRRQNQELLQTLEELSQRQAELTLLNRELADTNRGVVALYAELDEKADSLRRASEMKSRFLSNTSHEFRTPLNAILSLTSILLDRLDGPLEPEQEKQVLYIRKAAETLTELVNDLLDLAKVEAGKVTIRPQVFAVSTLFGALRGMLRPLLAQNTAIALLFEEPEGVPDLHTDESKVAQVLRNFISNALKYTERGEVRVRAAPGPGDTVVFSVTDTGIGIAEEDQETIFREFTQLESTRQFTAKGTGLGLPLSRKLAELLGGGVAVSSRLGVGSTFTMTLPRVYHGAAVVSLVPEVVPKPDPTRWSVLVVEDNREAVFIYEKFLQGTGYQVLSVRTLAAARQALEAFRPVAVILDVLLEHEVGWELVREIKQRPETAATPVYVVTLVDNRAKATACGADDFCPKPMERGWLLARLQALPLSRPRILIIDDDEATRYLLRGLLADTRYGILEAGTGAEGLRLAASESPSAVLLDLNLPDLGGPEVLRSLRAAEATRHLPVIVHTSRILTGDEREALARDTVAILPKSSPTRDIALARLREALTRIEAGATNPEGIADG